MMNTMFSLMLLVCGFFCFERAMKDDEGIWIADPSEIIATSLGQRRPEKSWKEFVAERHAVVKAKEDRALALAAALKAPAVGPTAAELDAEQAEWDRQVKVFEADVKDCLARARTKSARSKCKDKSFAFDPFAEFAGHAENP